MALRKTPGMQFGYEAYRVSSMNKRALGKLTDTNHLSSIQRDMPAMYDKEIISIYTQKRLMSNDFLQMINASTPFYPEGDSWQWKMGVPYTLPVVTAVIIPTADAAVPGIDGHTFDIVFDQQAFFKHDVITAHKMYAPDLYVVQDPVPYGRAWKYTVTVKSNDPLNEYVASTWLTIGTNYQLVDNILGEFDQQFSGLGPMGDEIVLYDSMAGEYGVEHKVTGWADARYASRMPKDRKGNPLDLIVYKQMREGAPSTKESPIKWEPWIESQMRAKMLDLRVNRFIWGKGGVVVSEDTGEVKKGVEGLYYKMRNNGNYHSYNKGEFSINMLRSIFGDLFYRREDIENRRVIMYTNEQGMSIFFDALKKDAQGSGIIFDAGSSDKFIKGSGQDLQLDFNFSSVRTLDSGLITVKHLKELDQPQSNREYGQNKKSTPIFMIFDVSSEGDGTPANNVREVRMKGAPSMTWGYIDGTYHHLGHAKSQGMSSANKFNGYEVWMKDRSDIFVEDLSKMVLIEEKPQY